MKTKSDITRELKLLADSVPRSKLFPALASYLTTVPAELKSRAAVIIDCLISNTPITPPKIAVFLVHGIRTDGAWFSVVKNELSHHGHVKVFAITYGFFTTLGLLGPFRKSPQELVAREIRAAKPQNYDELVVVAHSFGTYLLSRMAASQPDIRFDRIILCGSVVKPKFRWDVYAKEHSSDTIVNDVGNHDVFPILATLVTFGYGPSGRLGFGTPMIEDRMFDYKHSDFFSSNHINEYWVPFILEGKVIKNKTGLAKASLFEHYASKGPIPFILLLCFFLWLVYLIT